jgi:hypothetical protein
MISNTNNRVLHGLLKQTNMSGFKADLVSSFTKQRTEHSSEMHDMECLQLIEHLRAIKQGQEAPPLQNVCDPMDKMRKKILSICHELQWELPNGRIDFERLSAWLIKYGHKHHKHLNEYDPHDLPKLVTQFENLLKSTLYGESKVKNRR